MVLSMLMGFFMQQLAHAEVPVTIVVSDLHFGLGHAVDRSNNCSNEMTPIEDSEEPKSEGVQSQEFDVYLGNSFVESV